MLRDKPVGRIVGIRIEDVVRHRPQTRVCGVTDSRLLVEIRVGDVQQQAVLVAAVELRLERIGIAACEVSIRQQVLSNDGEREAGIVRVRETAVAIIWVAGRYAIAVDGSTEAVVTRRQLVEIAACDQPTHVRAEVRQAQGTVPADLALEGDVVLLDARVLQVHRYCVSRRRVAEAAKRSSGDRADAMLEPGPAFQSGT